MYDFIVFNLTRIFIVVLDVTFAYICIDVVGGLALNWTLIFVMAWVTDTAVNDRVREGLKKRDVIGQSPRYRSRSRSARRYR